MWSLSPFVLLLGACAKVLHAQVYNDVGMMMGSYPGMGSMGGMGSMSSYSNGMSSFDDPLLLNCFASFDDANGEVANEMTVTIEPKGESFDSLNMGGMGNMGMGYGMGGSSQGPGLSAKIQLFTNVNRGKAFVVFTERARVDQGCKIENFGKVLLSDDGSRDDRRGGYNMGYGGMGYGGMGYGGMGYGSMGYGGMGYGGMGYGGMGYGGMGYGMGYGMGMGHGSGSMFGDDGPKEGVVTELHVSAGALTTAVVDELDFDDLDDLAGRGVVICSDITYDWDWQPVCTEPIFSCCALKYDNVGLSLVGP